MQNRYATLIVRTAIILVIVVGVVSCGGSRENKAKAIAALEAYYQANEVSRGWALVGVTPGDGEKIDINIDVATEAEASMIKSKSRWEQFGIAKMGCPEPTQALVDGVAKGLRVWVHLMDKDQELAASVCPVLGH